MHILSYVLQNGKLDDTVPSASLTLLKLVHLLWDTLRFPSSPASAFKLLS